MEQFIANGLCRSAIYMLVALGFGLIYYSTRILHVAHGAVYTAAGYGAFLFLAKLGWPAVPSVVMALIGCCLLGLALEYCMYRPLYRQSASAAVTMISSLGAYLILVNALSICFGNQTRLLMDHLEKTYSVGSIILTQMQIIEVAVGLVGLLLFWLFLTRSRTGRLSRAFADNPLLADVMGVNIMALRLRILVAGSLLAGLGGVLSALDYGVDPASGFSVVLVAVVACIIGGFGSFLAASLGAAVLGMVQSIVIWQVSAKWESAVTFALLILFLLVRPQGILGTRYRLEES